MEGTGASWRRAGSVAGTEENRQSLECQEAGRCLNRSTHRRRCVMAPSGHSWGTAGTAIQSVTQRGLLQRRPNNTQTCPLGGPWSVDWTP